MAGGLAPRSTQRGDAGDGADAGGVGEARRIGTHRGGEVELRGGGVTRSVRAGTGDAGDGAEPSEAAE